jgi:glycosyltransferase involved in cell wall biosynthesis
VRVRRFFQSSIAHRREQLLSNRFTVVAVCSEEDRSYLYLPGPVHVIPNGFESFDDQPVRRIVDPPRIGFIGGLDYEPNADAIRWFVDRCWPEIKRQHRGIQLRVVGKENSWLLSLRDDDIHGLGYMPDAAEEIATWSAMIVPVRQGAGTRVKVAEGLSRKVPIVTTSLGRYGYTAKNGVELLIADSPRDFARACLDILQDRKFADQIAERGYQRFRDEWSWDAIRPRIWAAAEDCLRRSGSREASSTLVTS